MTQLTLVRLVRLVRRRRARGLGGQGREEGGSGGGIKAPPVHSSGLEGTQEAKPVPGGP